MPNLYVSIVHNPELPVIADALFEETNVLEQWDNGEETALLWSMDNGPKVLQAAHLNVVMGVPTAPFVDALGLLSAHFGLNIPCTQG